MEDTQPKQTLSPLPPPPVRIIDRLTEWAGWETLYEHQRKLFALLFLAVALLMGLGWFIANIQTSSIKSILKAESLVTSLTEPNESSSLEAQKASEKLFSLAENKEVLVRFCGTLAEEDLLKGTLPLTKEYFDKLKETLRDQDCPQLAFLAQATFSRGDIGLKQINEILEKIPSDKKMSSYIWTYTYALILKAKILSELGVSASQPIDELSSIFANNQSVANFFENWLHCSTNDFLNSIEKK